MIQTHTHTHSTVVSVSVTADQIPFQTPASYLATPLHFHGDAIKSNNTEKEGERGMMGMKMKWGRERVVLKRLSVAWPVHSSHTHTHSVLSGRKKMCALSFSFFYLLFVLNSSKDSLTCWSSSSSSPSWFPQQFFRLPNRFLSFPFFLEFREQSWHILNMRWFRWWWCWWHLREDEERDRKRRGGQRRRETNMCVCVFCVQFWSEQLTRLPASWCVLRSAETVFVLN